MNTRNCAECSAPLKRHQGRYCSHRCRGIVYSRQRIAARPDVVCDGCGVVFNPPRRGQRTRSTCSKACRYEVVSRKHKAAGIKPPGCDPGILRQRITGPNAPWWKGGGVLTEKGYVRIKPPAGWQWSSMVDAAGYIREHRVVMALHIGRALTGSEVVHHINGNRLDNRIENLEMFASHSEHIRTEHGSK